ncbi:MAG: hypothetical protein RR232_00540 [Clostridia bacterium]
MTLSISNLKLYPDADESSLKTQAARTLIIPENAINGLRIVRMSLDARKKHDIHQICTVEVTLADADEKRILKNLPACVATVQHETRRELKAGIMPLDTPIMVIGMGPAGLFAAYTLARCGYRPIIIERGRSVDERRADVERFMEHGKLDPCSNIMFGEGGAGTFSDGKLTTRIKDERASEVIELLARFGAPPEITVLAKPHIGTDRLITTIRNMRHEIVRLGGDVRFTTRLCNIETSDGSLNAIELEHNGIREKLPCRVCVLATGQGARDTYAMLQGQNMLLAPKAFAVGVRIEHPRDVIDSAQFGMLAGHPRLGAAEYHLADKAGERGVYTFCMCPGGVVVPSSSDNGQVVTNGMSCFARNGINSNAAIVVQVDERDFGTDALAGMRFQQGLEERAYAAGGGGFIAPAQRVEDFLSARGTRRFGGVTATYKPGVIAANLHDCLPEFVANGVAAGIKAFASRLHGFDLPDAVLCAVESRTSAPVRIMRGESGEAVRAKGLYPVGEGAGYAGGIVSAAVDGMRAAERIIETYRP